MMGTQGEITADPKIGQPVATRGQSSDPQPESNSDPSNSDVSVRKHRRPYIALSCAMPQP